MNLVEQFVELTKQVALEDPLRYTDGVDMDMMYSICASNVLEYYLSCGPQERDQVIISTTIHLTIENFLLNRKLISMGVNKES